MNASLCTRASSALALVCCAFASLPAFANAAGDEVPRLTVSYADLDLTRAEGAQTLYRRLRSAARQVCDAGYDMRALAERARYRACVEKAVEEAVRTIDRDVLTALHRRKAPRSATG